MNGLNADPPKGDMVGMFQEVKYVMGFPHLQNRLGTAHRDLITTLPIRHRKNVCFV